MIPDSHRAFAERASALFGADPRFVGLAAAGSWISGTMDAWSDVDLVAIVRDDAFDAVMNERRALVGRLGELLVTFTGEHVGEPRVMISLFDAPLLHVDVKFVALASLASRVEDPAVLWERDGAVTAMLARGKPAWPMPDPQWIEDRFWVWVHYGAVKIERGELFEAIDFLAFLRGTVLAPLAAVAAGRRPRGVRFVERDLPAFADELRATLAAYDAPDARRALAACVTLYERLRPADVTARSAAERAAKSVLRA